MLDNTWSIYFFKSSLQLAWSHLQEMLKDEATKKAYLLKSN